MGEVNNMWPLNLPSEHGLVQSIIGRVHCTVHVIVNWHEQGVVYPELCVVKRMEPDRQSSCNVTIIM